MSVKNEQLARRWFDEVWNQRRESAIDELFHPEGKAHGIPGTDSSLQGPEAYKENYRNFLRIFPDVQVHLNQVIADEDSVAVRWTASMTHLGDGLGFPPTNKAATLQGATFLTVKDGVFVEGWNLMDFQGLICHLQTPATESLAAPAIAD